jgi:hypothetical protein
MFASIPIIANDDVESRMLFPPDATVREASGDGAATGDAVEAGGGMVLLLVVDGELVISVEVEVVDSGAVEEVVDVVEETIGLDVVVVAVDDEESSMSMADTPLHSSNASTHGSRHAAHSSDSSSNSLYEEIIKIAVRS